MSSGHLSVARRQRATGPCFRRLGNFQGVKSGRSGAQRYERQEAPVAPGIAWPPVCNPASRPDASMLPIMWGGNNHPARARVGSSPRDGGGRARGTNTLRLLSKCCGRRLPVRLAFIFRDAVQVRNQPKRYFPFVPRRLNGQGPGVNLLGRGIEPRASTASQRPSVGLGKAWSIQVRGVFRRPAALHAGIVSHPPELGKVNVAKSSGVIASAISWNVMSIRAATRAKLSPVEQSAPGGRSPLAPNRKAQAV